MKKFLSVFLAAVMALSLCVTAFAAVTDAQQNTVLTGELAQPTLNLTVPATGKSDPEPLWD